MKVFFFFFLITFNSFATNGISRCEISGYSYKGIIHSDYYSLPQPPLPEACKKREKIDAEKIGEVYRENNAKLMALLQQILGNSQCSPLHDVLKQYLENVAKMREKYDLDAKARLDLLNKTSSFFDMQKDYAHMAAFSATCAGQEHRGAAMVDLDAINQILSGSGGSSEVTSNGQLIDNCSDVRAFGRNDLSGFRISLKNAKGQSFLFIKDAYSIADQVILKTSSGKILFDSGCEKDDRQQDIPLSDLGPDKQVIVEIKGSCEHTDKNRMTAWFVGVKCLQDSKVCLDEVDQLKTLMKQQIEYTKSLINIHAMELNCYRHYDVNILKDLKEKGLIDILEYPMANGPCLFLDIACRNKIEDGRSKERDLVPELNLSLKLVAPPAAVSFPKKANPINFNSREIFDAHCPPKTISSDSVLKLVSRTYCIVGFRKLGMNLDSF